MIVAGGNSRIPVLHGHDVVLLHRKAMELRERLEQPRILLIVLGIVLVLLIGIVDYITGPDFSFSIFYLIPIIFACLYIDLSVGIILSAASVAVSLTADLTTAKAHGDYGVAYWNAGVRLSVFLAVTYILAGRKRAEKNVRLYAQLHEIDREILSGKNPEHVAQVALQGLHKMISFQAATVAWLETEQESGTLISWMNEEESAVPLHFSLQQLEEEIKELHQGNTVLMQNGEIVVPFLPFPGLHRCIFVPLLYQGELVGSLNLGRTQSQPFEKDELVVVREVSNQLTVAVMNAKLFERLRESRDRLKLLSQRLLEVQEQERRHLARELHDEMGQALTAIKISLQTLESLPESSELRTRIRENVEVLESILRQVRDLTLDLRPLMLDDLGLVAALRWYLSRQSQLAGFTAHFSAEPSEIPVRSDVRTACFRIVQEAITNVVRHSKAKRVNLKLEQIDSFLYCTIQDDGIGFDVNTAEQKSEQGSSMGLLGMRERVMLAGGQIEIESVPSFGTEIRAIFPLERIPQ